MSRLCDVTVLFASINGEGSSPGGNRGERAAAGRQSDASDFCDGQQEMAEGGDASLGLSVHARGVQQRVAMRDPIAQADCCA